MKQNAGSNAVASFPNMTHSHRLELQDTQYIGRSVRGGPNAI
jgi:cytochrome b involved in lipid metabolism